MASLADTLAKAETIQNYEPTFRDRLRGGLTSAASFFGAPPAAADRFARGVAGSGLPQDAMGGLIDYTPMAFPLDVQEARRAAGQGRYLDAALSAVGPLADTTGAGMVLGSPAGRKALREGASAVGERLSQPGPMPVLGSNFGNVGAGRSGMGGNGGPRLNATRSGTGDLFYSAAEQALLDLSQDKGTVGQFVAQMKKHGVKPDELFWSGFDRSFPDPNQKVTRDEMADFFSRAKAPTTRSQNVASGKVGEPGWNESEAYDSFVEGFAQEGGLADEVIGDVIEKEVRPNLIPISEVSPNELANRRYHLGNEPVDDAIENGYLYDNYTQEFVDPEYLEDYARKNYSWDIDRASDALVRKYWEEGGRASEMESYADAGMFVPNNTEYSRYFTKGAEDYTENLFHPQTRVEALGPQLTESMDIYRAPHFAGTNAELNGTDYADDLTFHTRTGEMTTPDNRSAFHVGEIQSDYAQQNRGKIQTPEQSKEIADLMAEEAVYRGDAQKALYDIHEILPTTKVVGRGMGPEGFRPVVDDPNLGRYDQQYLLENYARVPEGEIVSPARYGRSGGAGMHGFRDDIAPVDPWDPRPVPEGWAQRNLRNQAEWTKEPLVQPVLPFRADVYDGVDPDGIMAEVNQTSADWDAEAAFGQPVNTVFNPPVRSGEPPRMQSQGDYIADKAWANSSLPRSRLADEPLLPLGFTPEQEQLGKLSEQYWANKSMADEAQRRVGRVRGDVTTPPAPFVTNTDKWVDAALKQSLADALQGSTRTMDNYDFMTLGTPELANTMTMMPEASGTEFYGKIVPKRMQKLLDKVAPGHKVTEVALELPDGEYVVVPGVKLTDELRAAVEKNGIPLYSLGGGMVTFGALNDEGGEVSPAANGT